MRKYTDEQMVIIANLYYMENLTQEQIAAKMRISRITVTRALKRARTEGMVRIDVARPMPALYKLGLELEKKFGLKCAKIAPSRGTKAETLEAVGRAGAEFLDSALQPGWKIGVAWSTTVHAILPYVRKPSFKLSRIVELAGTYLAPGTPYGVSWALADKLGVSVESIAMPVLVRNGRVKDTMIKEPSIQLALEDAASVDIALVGLGNVSRESSIMLTGYVGEEQFAELGAKGAVGDILMRYFDADGAYIPMSFEDQTISLEWEKIVSLPFVTAIAFGQEKVQAIEGALAGKVIHGLVTDEKTAVALLEL